jgi:RHS repeat-associated protein
MAYALYDRDSNMYDSGKILLSKKARNKHEELKKDIFVEKDGYIEAFVVNETSENVWYDNFSIQSTGPIVVQETHYDPWGVELQGLGYQEPGIKVNKYLYNGKEFNDHLGINLFDYGARMYDASIGRWFVVDPLADLLEDQSPYNYSFNDPIRYTDPDGKYPTCDNCDDVYKKGAVVENSYGRWKYDGDNNWIDQSKGETVSAADLKNSFEEALSQKESEFFERKTSDFSTPARHSMLTEAFGGLMKAAGQMYWEMVKPVSGSNDPTMIGGGINVPGRGGLNAANKISTIAKNAKKMSLDDFGKFLGAGKDWHSGKAKKQFLQQFKRQLKGDTNADFYIDENTKEVFLKSNKSGHWINTGKKFE